MPMDSAVSILNDLIETSKDGEKGFRKCAEDAKDVELKAFFQRGAESCARGAQELQALVTRLGEEPTTSGSVAGALHRGWVDVKAAVSSRDDLAILEECERGEDVAKASYRKALDSGDLAPDVRAVVQKQYEGVIRNHDAVKALRERFRALQH
jgi:uncharacterized protein (TIGR02284 family)